MGFLNKDSLPYLVEKLSDGSNIKITGNSKGNRVGTVIDKIVEKADDVTKAIEQEVVNESYTFKVGTGDVDVSSSVVDGFGEVGIKGVTCQNLFKVASISSSSEVELIDSSLSPLGFKANFGETIHNNGLNRINLPSSHLKNMLKPNSVYTAKMTIKRLDNLTETACLSFGLDIWTDEIFITPSIKGGETADAVVKFTTPSNIADIDNSGWYMFPKKLAYTSWQVSNFFILEGDHTSNSNLPSYFEGIVGVGDKSKNLFNKDTLEFDKALNASGIPYDNVGCNVSDFIEVIPNSTYVKSDNALYCEYDKDKNFIARYGDTSINTSANCKFVRINVLNTKLEGYQLEKGTVATTYEPYHDGHKIEILSNGKNILKPLINFPFDIVKGDCVNGNDGELLAVVKVKPNTKYIMSTKKSNDKGRIVVKMSNRILKATELMGGEFTQNSIYAYLNNNYANGRKFEYIALNPDESIEFTTLDDCNYLYINVDSSNRTNDDSNGTITTTVESVQLEEITPSQQKATPYQPYQEDKTQILLDEPLMRLDTSKDEITRDGKLIKRLCLTEVDGTEEWSRFYPHTIEEESIVFVTRLNKDSYINCEQDYRLKSTFAPANETNTILSKEAVQIYDSKLRVKLLKSRLTSLDVVGFKKWLSSNPIQILYLLKEPIIIDIVPPTLRIFKDGHLTFNTLVAPTSTHLVQINKSAQIERSIREVQSLDSRVGKLESFYDDMILETSHKLNLLNFDFDYMRNTEEEI